MMYYYYYYILLLIRAPRPGLEDRLWVTRTCTSLQNSTTLGEKMSPRSYKNAQRTSAF